MQAAPTPSEAMEGLFLASNQDDLDQRLRRPYRRDKVLSALEARIEEFQRDHACSRKELARDSYVAPSGHHSIPQELEILEKVYLEQKEFGREVPGTEMQLIRLLKNGVRDFVDMALDEVVARGSDSASRFTWESAGDSRYNPALLRSQRENFVADSSAPAGHLRPPTPERPPRPEAAFSSVDFVYDCCGPHARDSFPQVPPPWAKTATAATLAASASPPIMTAAAASGLARESGHSSRGGAADGSNHDNRFSIV